MRGGGERGKSERDNTSKWILAEEVTETERRDLMGDDNNTREKRIDVGKYLTLCDFENLISLEFEFFFNVCVGKFSCL